MSVVQEENEDIRGAKTQSLYRDVNERVRSLNSNFSVVLPFGEWFCECAATACDERIVLSPEEYERVRASGIRFIVAPGHVYPNIEDVTDRKDEYWIVEKYGLAGELAKKFNPRARVIGEAA